LPLSYLLRILRDPTEAEERRMYAAVAAAAYCHAKLKSVEGSGKEGKPIEKRVILIFD
jgi:hypothetical protein